MFSISLTYKLCTFFLGQNRKHVTFLRVTGYQFWEGHQPITPIQAALQSLIAKTVSSKGEWTLIFSIGNGSLSNVIFQGSTPEPSSTWFVARKWLSLVTLWPETMWIPSSASCHRLVSNSNTWVIYIFLYIFNCILFEFKNIYAI